MEMHQGNGRIIKMDDETGQVVITWKDDPTYVVGLDPDVVEHIYYMFRQLKLYQR